MSHRLDLRRKVNRLAFLGVLVGAFGWWATSPEKPHSSEVVPPVSNPYPHAVVTLGEVDTKGSVRGLGLERAGVVEKISANAGDEVEKGQELLSLNHSTLTAEINVLKEELAVATSRAAFTRRQLERAKQLTSAASLSDEQLDLRAHELDKALKGLEVIKAKIAQLETLVEQTIIRAPIAGKILQVDVQEGEYVTPNPAAPLLLLGNFSELQIRTEIPEELLCKQCDFGEAIAFSRDSSRNQYRLTHAYTEPIISEGKIRVSARDFPVRDSRVLVAVFTIEDPEGTLYPGQVLDVYIPKQQSAIVGFFNKIIYGI